MNFGATWSLTGAPGGDWTDIASSSDGSVTLAGRYGDGVWISSNWASTWHLSTVSTNTQTDDPSPWYVACSMDGTRLLAAGSYSQGLIFTSSNSGITWTVTGAPQGNWQSIASSGDGVKLIADNCCFGYVYTSQDAGITWNVAGAPLGYWNKVASSTNGAVIVAVNADALFASADSGGSWTKIVAPGNEYASLALSADGTKLVTIVNGGGIFVWQPIVPVIAAQPQLQTVSQGTNVVLDVAVLSTIPVRYQWQLDGTNLIGATNASLVLSNVSPAIAGSYSVLVTNKYGGGSSSNATLTVMPLVITAQPQPQNQNVVGGLSISYGISAASTVPLSYQWQFDGTNLASGTNAVLDLADINLANSGTYIVLVSDSYGTTISSNAILTVVPAFVSTLSTDWGISDAILGGSISTGSNSTVVWFNWGADTNYGNATPAYPVSDGATSLNFSNRITGLTPYATYHYQAVASNALGVVLGGDATFATTPRFNLTSGTNGNWDSIGWPTNGDMIFASSDSALYLSTNFGTDWLLISDTPLTSFIPSADGAKVAGLEGSVLYLTTNSGATWSSNSTPTNFATFAASGDLTKLVAVGGSQLYVSTNTGAAWSLSTAPSENWTSVASSADGTEFVALDVEDGPQFGEFSAGFIYLSTNSGATWSNIAFFGGETFVSSIACSGDGATLLMLGEFSMISNDSGRTWRPPQITIEAYNAAISSNGMTIVVVAGGEIFQRRVFVSPDFGVDWFAANAPVIPGPEPVLISSDGTKFAALDAGNIYISEPNPSPMLNIAVSGNNLLLSWIVPTTNFILQQSADLETWSTVTNAPSLNITNLQDQVLLPISQTQSFYRLKTL